MSKPRFLCVCENGNNRSVFMAYRLKRHGYEALACGWRSASAETLKLLCSWADVIIVMQDGFDQRIPAEFRLKTLTADVGPDKWGPRWHPEMKRIIYELYDKAQREGVF